MHFSVGNAKTNHRLGTVFFIYKGIISALNNVKFISGRVWYITLRGRWYDVLNVHAQSEEGSGDMRNYCVFPISS
jgi:hypothetical protein